MTPVTCPYCGQRAKFYGNSQSLYSSGKDYGPKWACKPCSAWVGCHPNTDVPLGRLANAELRKAKKAAHDAFDPLWRDGHMRRATAYAWLAKSLRIPVDECHIGMFDVAECERVVVVCTAKSILLCSRIDGSARRRQPVQARIRWST